MNMIVLNAIFNLLSALELSVILGFITPSMSEGRITIHPGTHHRQMQRRLEGKGNAASLWFSSVSSVNDSDRFR